MCTHTALQQMSYPSTAIWHTESTARASLMGATCHAAARQHTNVGRELAFQAFQVPATERRNMSATGDFEHFLACHSMQHGC
jgi:hypothetical protein